MNILQQIFSDHYEEIKYTLKLRPATLENIEKMIHCGDPSFGGAMYGCSSCGALKFVPFRCKSRFCPSCGTLYSIHRTTSMSLKLIQCIHRHCVFTIPEELRIFFRRDRSLLNCLFYSVRDVILRMFRKLNKSEHFTPGFICVLHTFGRSLQWNPHIHVLVSEVAVGRITPWKRFTHFNYSFLRKSFCTALLNHLHKRIGPSFKKMKSDIYKNHCKGFYVYAKPNNCKPSIVTKYIGRYLGRPVIATSRIDSYSGSHVTFHYNRHEDNKLITETLPVIDFIKKLIIHIPDKHFKMIRYYGIYHPSVSRSYFVRIAHLIPAIHPSKRPFLRSLSRWRSSILASFSSDPLRCSCGSIMHFLFLKFKKTTLDDLFRKVLPYPYQKGLALSLEHSLSSIPVLRSLFPKHNFITYVVANPPIRSVCHAVMFSSPILSHPLFFCNFL